MNRLLEGLTKDEIWVQRYSRLAMDAVECLVLHSKESLYGCDLKWSSFPPTANLSQSQAPFAFSTLFSGSETMFLLECLLDEGL